MKSVYNKRALLVIFISISFGVLLFISHNLFSPNLPEQFKSDIQATQTEKYKPQELPATPTGLISLFVTPAPGSPTTQPSLFATPLASISPTPTQTMNSYEVIGGFLTQTATLETPTFVDSFLDPMGAIAMFATQTALVKGASTSLPTSLNNTPSPTSTLRVPTTTPNSIFMTLTANSGWQTAQVATIRATAYPALSTAAANLKGTATFMPTATVVPTQTFPPFVFTPNPPPSTGSLDYFVSSVESWDFNDGPFIFLSWLLPSFLFIWSVGRVKKRLGRDENEGSDINFIIFYSCGLALSFFNDVLNTEFKLSEYFSANIFGMLTLTAFLSILSLLFVSAFVEMSRGFDLFNFVRYLFSNAQVQVDKKLNENRQKHFLLYGAGIVVFLDFFTLFVFWKTVNPYSGGITWILVEGLTAYLYIFLIEITKPDNHHMIWEDLLNALFLPIVGIIKAIYLLLKSIFVPDIDNIKWWFVLIKYGLATALPLNFLYYFVTVPDNSYNLFTPSLNLAVKLFLLPYVIVSAIYNMIAPLLTGLLSMYGDVYITALESIAWVVSSFAVLVVLAWLLEVVARTTPYEKRRTLRQVALSDLTKGVVDIFTSLYLFAGLLFTLFETLGRGIMSNVLATDSPGDFWAIFLFIDVLFVMWSGRYLVSTIRKLDINWRLYKWYSTLVNLISAALLWPILTIGRLVWKIIILLISILLSIVLVVGCLLGTIPDFLAYLHLPFAPGVVERLTVIVYEYDFLVHSVSSGSFTTVIITTTILVVFLFWATWGVYLKYRSIKENSFPQVVEAFMSALGENLATSLEAGMITFFILRFINILLFIVPGIPSSSIWLVIIYEGLAALLYYYFFSRAMARDSKAVLGDSLAAPFIWLSLPKKPEKQPSIAFDEIKKFQVWFQQVLHAVGTVLRFLFLSYPTNRGIFKIRLSAQEQRNLRYRVILGEGFYLEQSVLFVLVVLAASSFSPALFRDLERVFLFVLLLFISWFYTKQSYEENLFRNYKILLRLIGTAFVSFLLVWLLWYLLIPLIYMILLAMVTRSYFGFLLVRQWLQNNPPFPYLAEIIFISLFFIMARKILYRMWSPQLSSLKADFGKFYAKLTKDGPRSVFRDLTWIIRHPRSLPNDMPKSFLLVFGGLFYILTYLLVWLISSLIFPALYSPIAILQKVLSSQVAILLVIPVVTFLASNPVMYIKYYFPLIASLVDRFNKQGNYNALSCFISKPLLFSGYRKSFQNIFVSFFFAYGLTCLLLEPVRTFFWLFPGWSAFILLIEMLCCLSLGSLLAANFIRIIPVLAVIIGTIFVGISFFSGAALGPYFIGFALFVFIIGLGNYSINDASWLERFSSPGSAFRNIKKLLFDFDALEYTQANFSDLIVFERDDSLLDVSHFREGFEAAVGKCSPQVADRLAALADPMRDPIRQSLILYAYSDFDDFRAYAAELIFPPADKTDSSANIEIQDHVRGMITHLYLVSLENLDAVLKAVISLRMIRPQMHINVSPIPLSDILPVPFEQNARYVVDFSAEERNAIETYLDKDKSVSDLMAVWLNFVDDSVIVKELCSLYEIMMGLNLVNKIDEIATLSLSMRDVIIPPDSVHNDLYQVLLKIANIADIVARASVQRLGHRSHEYSFALKQLQVVQAIHLPKLTARDQAYLSGVLDLWARFITESLIYEPTQPHLSVSIESAHLNPNTEETLVMVIMNDGESTALDVQIELLTSDNLGVLAPELPLKVDEILGRSSARLEFNVILRSDEDAELGIGMSYSDVRQKQYSLPEVKTVLRRTSPDLVTLSFDDNIANPYVYGPAVTDPDHFFGRQKTLLAIEQRLRDVNQTSIIMLFGQRRMGKSSILKKVANRYSQMNSWWPIYIDGATIFAKQVPELMQALAIRIWSKLPEDHGLPSPNLVDFQNDPGHALVDQFLPSVDKVIRDKGRSLLILFDEFDTFIKTAQSRFNREEVQEVLWVIREFAQGMSTGGFIYAGTYELLDMSRLYHAPLFNLAEQIKIGPLEQEAARNLICVPGSRYLQFNEDAVQKIMRLSGCHPYFIQLLCNKVFDVAVNEDTHVVGVSLLNKALVEAQEQENAFFNVWSERGEDQRLTLSALAQIIEYDGFLAPVTRIQNILELGFVSIEIDRIQNAVDRLVQEEILQKDNDLFGFSVDLLRLWVRARKSLPSVRAEIGYRI